MKPTVKAVLLVAALVAPSAALAAAPHDHSSQAAAPMVGGWSELRLDEPELQAVARFVVPRLGRRNARLLRIAGGERQIVAGTNYRIALQLTDRTRWRAQVWRKLDGSYELTRFARIK